MPISDIPRIGKEDIGSLQHSFVSQAYATFAPISSGLTRVTLQETVFEKISKNFDM